MSFLYLTLKELVFLVPDFKNFTTIEILKLNEQNKYI